MLILPIPTNEGKASLLIVLEDENIERIKEHDCAEIYWSSIGQFAGLRPKTIAIGYANPAEMKRIQELAQEGKVGEAIKLMTGGFKFRPEAGDHDFGPVSLRKKGD